MSIPRIPVCKPFLWHGTIDNVKNAFDAGWLGQGWYSWEFQREISEYFNREAVVVNTGTSALHLGLLAAGVGPGDEVITPSFNYVADHQAILMTGADVVMCDVLEDCTIDVGRAETLITERTKAILPLHYAGTVCDLRKVYGLAEDHGLRVVEDCCHAFGSEPNGRRIGSFGDIACFSFDPVKVLTCGDGGAVVVNEGAEELRRLRYLGVSQDTHERIKEGRPWEYDVTAQGFRYHMNDIAGAIGMTQLGHIDELIDSRRRICEAYNEAFEGLEDITPLVDDFTGVSPFIYVIKVEDRDSLIAHLDALGISVGVHFPPVHEHTFFADCRRGDMSVTDRLAKQVLSLPLHSHMRPDFVERVIEGVRSWR